jgi:peptidylprolyl isomerase
MLQAIKQAKPGDRVKVHFNGTMADGTLFDTTYEGSCGCDSDNCNCGDDNCNGSDGGCGCGDPAGPMELEIGAESFFPQVEEALIGMAVGDRKAITIKTADAFGENDAEQVSVVSRDQFPDDIDPQVGDSFELVNDDGEGMVVTVIEVNDKEITLDANHPLAGEDLTFELELIEIY